MSDVARILEAYGQAQAEAARQKAAVWGGAIQQIGQIPQQMQQAKLLQAREQRLTQQAASEQELFALKLQDAQDARADQTLTGQLVQQYRTEDPATGHLQTDHEQVYQGLLAKGRTKAAENYLNFANAAEEHANAVQNSVLATEAKKQSWRADVLSKVGDAPSEDRRNRYAVMMGTLSGIAQNDPILKQLPPEYPGDEAFQRIYDNQRTHEQRIKDQTTAAETRLKTAQAQKAEMEAARGPKRTEAELAADYQDILKKIALKQPLTAEEKADKVAFENRKLMGPEYAAVAAANRQAQTIGAQVAQQQRAQTFTEAQAGRKELTDKYETPYQTSLASSNTLRDVVAAAQAGNKVAGSLQSLETTMAAIRAQGLNRINTAEIGVTANAGNMWDRIQGWIGKAESGQPVPENIQKDMLQFADILDKAAYQKYITGHRAIKKRYGLTDEIPLPPPASAGPSPDVPHTVTLAELGVIAKQRGTTVDQERARAIKNRYTVVQ